MDVVLSTYDEIKSLRLKFLSEINHQVRYDSCHWREWSDEYLIFSNGDPIGYGSVKGKDKIIDRDTLFEFYLAPKHRRDTLKHFNHLLSSIDINFIECQSNDSLLYPLMESFAATIYCDVILFEHQLSTTISKPEVVFREREETDKISWKSIDELGQYVLEMKGTVIADGGFLTHYNKPFADIFMEVHEEHQGKGYASYLIQEIVKKSYKENYQPAARCNVANRASKRALENAGFKICGSMCTGVLNEVFKNTQ